MNTPAINRTAALALAAAKHNVDTPQDVAKSPSWKAPEKQEGGSARTSIEKSLASVSNRGTLPSVVQNYVNQMRGKMTLQAPPVPSKTTGTVPEAAYRLAKLIPSLIAWELNNAADRLTEKMKLANEDSPTRESQVSPINKPPARESSSPKAENVQASSLPPATLEFRPSHD